MRLLRRLADPNYKKQQLDQDDSNSDDESESEHELEPLVEVLFKLVGVRGISVIIVVVGRFPRIDCSRAINSNDSRLAIILEALAIRGHTWLFPIRTCILYAVHIRRMPYGRT